MIAQSPRPVDCRLMERSFSLPIDAGDVRLPQAAWCPLMAHRRTPRYEVVVSNDRIERWRA